MADNDLKQLKTKKRYQCLFDGGILSVNSCSYISEEFSMLFRDKAKVYCETGDFLIGLKPEQRIEFRKLILGKVKEANWSVETEGNQYSHHFLLTARNPDAEKMLAQSTNDADEEDFMDLSGLWNYNFTFLKERERQLTVFTSLIINNY